jgi:hypothetical protein
MTHEAWVVGAGAGPIVAKAGVGCAGIELIVDPVMERDVCVRARTVKPLVLARTGATVCRIVSSRDGSTNRVGAGFVEHLTLSVRREKGTLMNTPSFMPRAACAPAACAYLLRFLSRDDRGQDVTVPCDEAGNVDMNALTEHLRNTYLGARAMVGRDYLCPTVQTAPSGPDHQEPPLLPFAA